MRTLHDHGLKKSLCCWLQQRAVLRALLCWLMLVGSVSYAASPEDVSLERSADHRTLIDRIVKERAATAEDEILRFAGLIRSSVKVSTWASWSDQQVKSALVSAAIQHPDWSASYSSIDYANAIAQENKGALLPQLSGGVDYGERQYGSNPITRSSDTQYVSTSMQLTMKQLLYDGFSRWDAWKSSEQKARAQELRAGIQQSEVILKLLEANLNKQRLELQKYWLLKFNDQRKKTVEKITKRYAIGASTIFDIARSELKTHDVGVSLAQTDQQYKNALSVFQEFDLPLDLSFPTVAELIPNSSQDLDRVVADHPVIKESEQLIESARLELESAQARRNSPQVNLEIYKGGRDFNGYAQRTMDSSVLLTLTHNIYSGGSDSAKLSQASSKLMQSKDDLSARKKTIRTTLVKSASDVNALSESLNYRKLAVESSIASFAASSKLFEINRGNLTDFQRVEDDLNDKVRQLIDNWFDLSIAYYRHLHVSDSLKSQFLSPHKAQPQSSGLPL